MPEAVVHEAGQVLLAEDKVGLSEHGLIPPPANNASLLGNGDKGQFGAAVASSTIV